MLIIHVTHFLDDAGLRYFEEWYHDCYGFISKQDGFRLLEKAYDNAGSGAVHLWLHFESREKMLLWGNSDAHAMMISKLDRYRTQDWLATWYDTDIDRVETFVIPRGWHSVISPDE